MEHLHHLLPLHIGWTVSGECFVRLCRWKTTTQANNGSYGEEEEERGNICWQGFFSSVLLGCLVGEEERTTWIKSASHGNLVKLTRNWKKIVWMKLYNQNDEGQQETTFPADVFYSHIYSLTLTKDYIYCSYMSRLFNKTFQTINSSSWLLVIYPMTFT